MIVKNTTGSPYPISSSVQTGVDSPDANDGVVLAGQTLDLSVSMDLMNLIESQELKDGIESGDLVLIVGGQELDSNQSTEIYNSGPAVWAKNFSSEVIQSNLYEGIASGFMYVKNCLIG